MSDKEILKKAIEKARTNGYNDAYYYSHLGEFGGEKIYFSHNFAKAFWGDALMKDGYVVAWEGQMKPDDINGPAEYDASYEQAYCAEWKVRLKEMVLEEEPLKYLAQFLD